MEILVMEVRRILEYIKDLLGEDFSFTFLRLYNFIPLDFVSLALQQNIDRHLMSQLAAVGVEHKRGTNRSEFSVALLQSELTASVSVDDFSSSLHNPSLSLLSLHNMNSRGVIHYCFTGLFGSGGSSASGGRLMGLDTGAFFFLKRLLKKFM